MELASGELRQHGISFLHIVSEVPLPRLCRQSYSEVPGLSARAAWRGFQPVPPVPGDHKQPLIAAGPTAHRLVISARWT